ncbi:MAG TPA: DUF4404 family protein [Candidatus Kapabacteria bacterium]|jgi:F0F1-type ATP synthase membrane subunit b/b'|nr:DUF4404 family protein [Candidatus Kapabacteria bacterium]
MIEDTIARIEKQLEEAQAIPAEVRQELENLLGQLRQEARSLPQSAPSFEASHAEDDANTALGRLQESLSEFETTHPQLVSTVNRISTILANMGI